MNIKVAAFTVSEKSINIWCKHIQDGVKETCNGDDGECYHSEWPLKEVISKIKYHCVMESLQTTRTLSAVIICSIRSQRRYSCITNSMMDTAAADNYGSVGNKKYKSNQLK